VALIRTQREVRAPAAAVWQALVDWPAHGRWVPLTRVSVQTGSGHGLGARFVGRTGIGPLAFDDPMEVVGWQPPVAGSAGHCAVVKHGRLLLGRASFSVTPTAAGSRVLWQEDVELAPARLTRPFAPVLAWLGRVAFDRMLAAMAAEVERAHG
jgi:hypothetical protein